MFYYRKSWNRIISKIAFTKNCQNICTRAYRYKLRTFDLSEFKFWLRQIVIFWPRDANTCPTRVTRCCCLEFSGRASSTAISHQGHVFLFLSSALCSRFLAAKSCICKSVQSMGMPASYFSLPDVCPLPRSYFPVQCRHMVWAQE